VYFVLRHQKPKQQKTEEKRKNQRVFFWNGIVVGVGVGVGRVESKSVSRSMSMLVLDGVNVQHEEQ